MFFLCLFLLRMISAHSKISLRSLLLLLLKLKFFFSYVIPMLWNFSMRFLWFLLL